MATAVGLPVLTGRAVAAGLPTPFRPFAEALGSAGRAGLPASEDLDPFWAALGRLIPSGGSHRVPRPMSLLFSLARRC